MRRLSSVVLVCGLVASPVVAQVTVESATRVVLRVNGDPIFAREVQMAAEEIAHRMVAAGQPVDGERIGKEALESLVDGRLLVQEARRRHLVVDEKALQAALDEAESSAGGAEQLRKSLASEGLDWDHLQRMTQETLLVHELAEQLVAGTHVSDREVEAFYLENRESFRVPEQVKTRQIVVMTTPEMSAEEKEAAKAKAEALRKRALAGEDFATLAREHSDAPNASRGGETGYFSPDAQGSELSQVVFALRPGEISRVVPSQFGYHIVRLEDRKPAREKDLQEVSDAIRKKLAERVKTKRVDELLRELRSTAKVVPVTPSGS